VTGTVTVLPAEGR